jgi:hypothetical protein
MLEQSFDAEHNGVYEAAVTRREGLRERAALLIEDHRREIDAVVLDSLNVSSSTNGK